jgi:hypothetical protein
VHFGGEQKILVTESAVVAFEAMGSSSGLHHLNGQRQVEFWVISMPEPTSAWLLSTRADCGLLRETQEL